MSQIELHQSSLTEQMNFAAAVVREPDRGGQSLLPREYQNNPANVLIAVGLGQSMGLSPAESLYRITVIQGKPTAAAELIAANVRKAGHRLRVKVTENPPSATCTIIRADDPDEPTTVTRDMDWAQRMGLANKDNYKKQPSTMLSWRAISACARLACPEALYGVAYTPDEIDTGEARPSSGGMRTVMSERTDSSPAPDVAASEPAAPPATSPADEGDRREQASAGEVLLNTSSKLAKAMYAAIREHGIGKEEASDLYLAVTGREVESSKELTEDEARAVLRALDDREKDTPLIDVTEGELVDEPGGAA